jgi:hypothetical protein
MSMDDIDEFQSVLGTNVTPMITWVFYRADNDHVIIMKKADLPPDAIYIKVKYDGMEEWWSTTFKAEVDVRLTNGVGK